jgi:hypothetical protein
MVMNQRPRWFSFERTVGWVDKLSFSQVDKVVAGFRSSTQPTAL